MRFVYPAARLLALVTVFVPQMLLAQAPGLAVTNYQFVAEERISAGDLLLPLCANSCNSRINARRSLNSGAISSRIAFKRR